MSSEQLLPPILILMLVALKKLENAAEINKIDAA
jgi:hypothetical protein